MKSFLLKLLILSTLLSLSWVHATLFGDSDIKNPYCVEQDCSRDDWIEEVRNNLDGIIIDRPLSEYIQDVVQFLLGFLSIIAVIYIIYAGFVLLTSGWDDEKLKTTKNTIIYVIIGLAVIWLAGPITTFVFRVLGSA